MYGKTASSQQFFAREAMHSTKGSRRGFVDVNTGVNPADLLSPAQQRDSLKRQHAALARRRDEVKSSRAGKDEWKRLGVEMFEIQERIRALNAVASKTRDPSSFDEAFNVCARSMLTTSEYERISEAARRRMIEKDSHP